MNKQILLKSRPTGMPVVENFTITEVPIPLLKEGELLVKAKYISVDPYMRGRMNEEESYIPPFEIGKPISGGVIAEVTESNHNYFNKGDIVMGNMLWQEQQAVNAERISSLNKDSEQLSYYLGILGMPGLTAYFGLLDIGKPKKGETVVISGAAGAVGMVVGQIARIKGCRVIGIAGSSAKTTYLRDNLQFDEAINYHSANLEKAISKACPNGVDIYFDNVGGEISDTVISHINKSARIIICGQISLYNETKIPVGPRIQSILLKKSALMQGFLVNDYADKFEKGNQDLSNWIKDGKLLYEQTIINGFEKLPEAFIGLFQGKNIGKYLVEVF
jgi:NADPH:quinone reductase